MRLLHIHIRQSFIEAFELILILLRLRFEIGWLPLNESLYALFANAFLSFRLRHLFPYFLDHYIGFIMQFKNVLNFE